MAIADPTAFYLTEAHAGRVFWYTRGENAGRRRHNSPITEAFWRGYDNVRANGVTGSIAKAVWNAGRAYAKAVA